MFFKNSYMHAYEVIFENHPSHLSPFLDPSLPLRRVGRCQMVGAANALSLSLNVGLLGSNAGMTYVPFRFRYLLNCQPPCVPVVQHDADMVRTACGTSRIPPAARSST